MEAKLAWRVERNDKQNGFEPTLLLNWCKSAVIGENPALRTLSLIKCVQHSSLDGTGISCDPTPGSAATLPMPGISCDPTHKNSMEGSTFFLYQGSAVTLPDFSVKNPTGFCTVSRLFRFKYNIPFIKFSPPPWQPMLCDPTWQHSFYQISSPLGNPCFQWFKFKYNIPFIKFPPPPCQPMLCDPTWQHSFYKIFPPLGNPCFQWFKFKYNIPFIKFPPPLGNPCFATLPDNIPFIKFSPPPPLETHAFNDSSSSTTFLLSNFSPPLATHALRPYLTTFLFSNFPPPPLATHAFNDSNSSTTFLL